MLPFRKLLLTGLLLFNQTAFATDWIYLDAGVSRASVQVEDTEFNPVLPRIKLGIELYEGILLEFQYVGGGDDKASNMQVEIEEISAAYLRLDTPIIGTMRMFVLLGGAETSLKVKGTNGSTAGSGTYEDFSWGFGLEEQFLSKHTLLTLEYTEYYNHDDVTISSISLGFKVEY